MAWILLAGVLGFGLGLGAGFLVVLWAIYSADRLKPRSGLRRTPFGRAAGGAAAVDLQAGQPRARLADDPPEPLTKRQAELASKWAAVIDGIVPRNVPCIVCSRAIVHENGVRCQDCRITGASRNAPPRLRQNG